MSKQAYSYIVKLLSSREYSEHKLREKLKEKKFPANEIDSAINEVKERGYLREQVYAEARIKGFMHKGYSMNHIRQRLSQEHVTVTDEEIQEVFDEYHISEEDQIERLAKKKIGTKTEMDFDQQGKVLRYLISKGHNFSLSKKVMKSVLGENLADFQNEDL